MALPRVVEDALGRRGLAGVDVRHDAEISVVFDLVTAGHGRQGPEKSGGSGESVNGAGGLAQTARAWKRTKWPQTADHQR
jgi:hypothetical protein